LTTLQDGFGRRFAYLRLSVTDVCNFRCEYCLPDGYQGKPTGFMSVDEIRRLVTGFAELGTTKVRLTGGEPMVRKDFMDIVRVVRETPGIEKLAMTTNGYKLRETAGDLKTAGLDAINISIDSLESGRFEEITGDRRFEKVIESVETCLEAGFESIKINTVLLKGLNDHQLDDFFEYVRTRPIALRFIELMQTGDNQSYFEQRHVSGDVVREKLLAGGWQRVESGPVAGPAVEYRHAGFLGRIGLIAPYAPGFCDTCNRLRVTARGGLRLCLFGTGTQDLRPFLQRDEDTEMLKACLLTALLGKKIAHGLHDGNFGDTPHLAYTGG